MRTIIIHHLQMMWETSLLKTGTSFEEMIIKVYEHLQEQQYDRVIVTNFEANANLDPDQELLKEFDPEVYDYMYGWQREEIEEQGDRVEGTDFCEGGMHSEIVMIDEWMRELEGKIYLCGAFDGECIEDMEIALHGAGKEFKRINELIV